MAAMLLSRAGLMALLTICSLQGIHCQGPLYFIHAPSLLRLGVTETVAVVLENVNANIQVTATLQSVGAPKRILSTTTGTAVKGKPVMLELKVAFDQIPPLETGGKQFVTLTVSANSAALKFSEAKDLLISRLSRETFIQTDKPIYTPGQTVRARIIPVNFHLKHVSALGGLVEIKNANGDIVERWNQLASRKSYITKSLHLGDNPVIGNWTMSYVRESQNTSVQFEVREYTLPRFSVVIISPPYVLETDNALRITLKAKYVYGREVSGLAILKIGIINDRGDVIPVYTFRDMLDEGEALCDIPMNIVKRLPGGVWFPDGDRLMLDASVVERATGHVESTLDTSVYFANVPFKITFKETMKYFKPGLPFEVQVNVRYPNQKPAPFASLSIKGSIVDGKGKSLELLPYSSTSLRAVTDAVGNARVIFGVPRDAVRLDIEAKAGSAFGLTNNANKVYTYQVTPYQSPSASYVLVRSPQLEPRVNAFATMEVFMLTSQPIKELHYMISSKGRVVVAKSIPNPGAILTLRFKVTVAMSPLSNMVVYYTIVNGGKTEVVSDFVPFKVSPQFDNEVTIEAVKDVKPGKTVNLTVRGSPNSEAAILAVDKSVYLLRDTHRLSRDMVFKRLVSHDLSCSFGGGLDASRVFKDAGLLTMSNAGIEANSRKDLKCDAPKSRKRRSSQDKECCNNGIKARALTISCNRQAEEQKLTESCRDEFIDCCRNNGRSAAAGVQEEEDIEEEGRQVQIRSNFPETWLFGDVTIDESGVGILSVTVPDTITTWVLQAFASNPVSGFGVAKSFELVAFKPFFLQLNIPYSVNRGEQLMLSATLFNYKSQKEIANVYMQGDAGICYEGTEGQRSSRRRIEVNPNDAYTMYFPLIPLELGPSNVTVIAYTRDTVDAVRRPLNVEPEGIENIVSTSKMIDPTASAGDRHQNLVIPLKTPANTIPGSRSATAFITGDLLGPMVTKLLKNVDKALIDPVDVYQVSSTETYTVTVPVKYTFTRSENYQQFFRSFDQSCTCNSRNGGCLRSRSATRVVQATGTRQVQRTRTRTVWRQADRFVVRSIAPNVYVLRYLSRTNQLVPAVENKAKAFITESYRRLLGHKTPDGSFSLWGNEAGTLWLTAFIAQNLEDASEFVAIDQKMKCKAVDFLLKSQLGDGSFLEDGSTYTKAMMGGNNADPAMTAFVMTSLLAANCPELTMRVSTAIDKSKTYLENKLSGIKRPYDAAVVAYALVQTNSGIKLDALEKLENMATYDAVSGIRYWKGKTESVSIEASAYAMLALLQAKRLTYVKSIVKYLVSHQNSDGGFSAGQDTVVGLKALSQYATVQPALDLTAVLTSTSDPAFKERVRIDKSSALVQEMVQVPPAGSLMVQASGVGTAQIQVEVHYNTPKLVDDTCDFAITTAVNEESLSADTDTFTINLQMCVRHTGDDIVGLSSVEVGILTGFVPMVRSFETLRNKSLIQRYEYSDRTIILYLNKISNTVPVCLPMLFQRAFDVGLVQPAHITVKDLLAPDITCSSFYSPSGSSPMLKKICKGDQCKCMAVRCASCRPTRMRSNFCQKPFVARIKIKDNGPAAGNWKVFEVYVQRVYRGSDVIAAKTTTEVWLSGTCTCPRFYAGGVFLVMGDITDERLEINEDTFVRAFPNRRRNRAEFDRMDRTLQEQQARGCAK